MFVIDPLFNGLVPGLGFVWGAYLVLKDALGEKYTERGRRSGKLCDAVMAAQATRPRPIGNAPVISSGDLGH